ncbi:hypothetical protein IV203_024581 [Nitzschia inconspicua]|uniref:Uncharacterized protein n=1 Tax=Nitzschia inconspicua TaxID=303405 RepID=A0A9K3K3Y1_9STRA|nr:hypothetical protein IV203_024581 [Nitzschia inconspicua]
MRKCKLRPGVGCKATILTKFIHRFFFHQTPDDGIARTCCRSCLFQSKDIAISGAAPPPSDAFGWVALTVKDNRELVLIVDERPIDDIFPFDYDIFGEDKQEILGFGNWIGNIGVFVLMDRPKLIVQSIGKTIILCRRDFFSIVGEDVIGGRSREHSHSG